MIKRMIKGMTVVVLMAGLSACSDFRRAVGDEKSSPDEFQVVVRPPLSLPPGFSDRPEDIVKQAERKGADAQSSTEKLLEVSSSSESGFASLFDFSAVPSNIRTKVDEETYGIQIEKRLPLQMLFGGVPNVGPVLDKMGEATRLRKAQMKGEPTTATGTKAIDPANDQPVVIQ